MALDADMKTFNNELIYALLVDQKYSGQLLKVFFAYIIKAILLFLLNYEIIPSYEDHDWYILIYIGLIFFTLVGFYTEYQQLRQQRLAEYV